MKKIVLTSVFILISSFVLAQEQDRKNLKGPAFKNYKVWEHKLQPVVLYVGSDKLGLQGPAYKNYKPWENKNKLTKIVAISSKRPKVTGPKYKNYKPWKNSH